MVAGTRQTHVAHKGYQLFDGSLVYAISGRHRIQFVEHFKDQRTRLVNGANDRSTFLGKTFQQRYASSAR